MKGWKFELNQYGFLLIKLTRAGYDRLFPGFKEAAKGKSFPLTVGSLDSDGFFGPGGSFSFFPASVRGKLFQTAKEAGKAYWSKGPIRVSWEVKDGAWIAKRRGQRIEISKDPLAKLEQIRKATRQKMGSGKVLFGAYPDPVTLGAFAIDKRLWLKRWRELKSATRLRRASVRSGLSQAPARIKIDYHSGNWTARALVRNRFGAAQELEGTYRDPAGAVRALRRRVADETDALRRLTAFRDRVLAAAKKAQGGPGTVRASDTAQVLKDIIKKTG